MSYEELVYENADTIGYARHIQQKTNSDWQNINGTTMPSKESQVFKNKYGPMIFVDTSMELKEGL